MRLRSVHCVALVTCCYAKPVLRPSKLSSQPYLRPRPSSERRLRTSLRLKIAGKPFSRPRSHSRENLRAQRRYQRQERESRRRRKRQNREYESQNRREQRRREREMRRHHHNSRRRGRNPVSSVLTFFRSLRRSLSFSSEEQRFLLCCVLFGHILLSYFRTYSKVNV